MSWGASWWTLFRRELDRRGVRRLSNNRWSLAVELKRLRKVSPEWAARRIAQMPPR